MKKSLLSKEEWKFRGKWIQNKESDYGSEAELYYQKNSHTLLKKNFNIKKIEETRLYIASLGYHIGYLNGQRIEDYELNSDWTNYKKCIYYDVYDITQYLQLGDNELIFELGNGMYNPAPLKLLGKYNLRSRLSEIGTPKLICDVASKGEILLSSDMDWKVMEGNRIFNNLYLGETINFIKKNDYWDNATTKVFMEQEIMKKSFIPKIKQIETVAFKSIQELKGNLIIDFGEMISGFIRVKINGKKNQKIYLKYGESIKDEEIDFESSYAGSVGSKIGDQKLFGGLGSPEDAIQQDIIICDEGINDFQNKFSYHSFRYLQIEGCTRAELIDIKAIYVHSDLKQTGLVNTDNLFLNELYAAALRTKLNNIHSVFEDCARERLGYGGDIVALASSNLYMFALEDFIKKVIYDFRFDQTKNGGIPETAPFMGIQTNGTGQGEGPILWQFVYPYLTYKHYQFYGDKEFVKQEAYFIEKQMNYLLSIDINKVVQCCLGDHGSPIIAGHFKIDTPDKLFVGYCTILLFLKYNIFLKKILEEDSKRYEKKYDELKEIVNDKFLNVDQSYGDRTQTSFAFAIELGLGDSEKLANQLAKKIQKDRYILNSGIFGMAFTYDVLNKYGHNDVIEEWLFQESKISFKNMLSNGNQALAELFIGDHYSMNHAMFASYQQWYFEALAGISIAEDAVGFSKLLIKPYFSKKVNKVEGSITTKKGEIHSVWEREDDKVVLELTVPENIEVQLGKVNDHRLDKIEKRGNKLNVTYTTK
ncbi:family 78 glycoside hydrolase catalytic domain [Enterococcus hulanensis]|uniref:family 78 glycoside hydrolase catalytic domain n=1 Tax=Enterococcus hulanensis TaxID=2559929 RepID=UPI001A8D8126|nr:family 78 glycoside hydrolase catalytic domain [Enterococcus hulanensis]MBO0458119.1 family 78 glycoside hydrolase catalytic domain [Enterococcus hulanensis]